MIAGKSRFYVVAAMVGAIVGTALAGGMAIGLGQFFAATPIESSLVCAALLLVVGLGGGAYGGVVLMRMWYRRVTERQRTAGGYPPR